MANHHQLPPVLAQFGTQETFLIELQGSIHVEGDKLGTAEDPDVGVVGIFDASNEVSYEPISFVPYLCLT